MLLLMVPFMLPLGEHVIINGNVTLLITEYIFFRGVDAILKWGSERQLGLIWPHDMFYQEFYANMAPAGTFLQIIRIYYGPRTRNDPFANESSFKSTEVPKGKGAKISMSRGSKVDRAKSVGASPPDKN